jgi:hypothetical protein
MNLKAYAMGDLPLQLAEYDWRWRRAPGAPELSSATGEASVSRARKTKAGGKARTSSNPAQDVWSNAGVAVRRKLVALGFQPAVVKVISTATGVTRAKALVSYIGQREDPHSGVKFNIPVTTETGRVLMSHEERTALLEDWRSDFNPAPPSDDVGVFALSGLSSEDQLFPILRELFGDRPGIVAFERRDGSDASSDAAMSDHAPDARSDDAAPAPPFSCTVAILAGARRARISLARDSRGLAGLERKLEALAPGARLGLLERAHDRSGIEYVLTQMAQGVHGEAFTLKGEAFGSDDVAAQSRVWTQSLAYRKRDVLHVMYSACAGTEPEAFEAAVSEALAQDFAGRRYIYARHDDRRHVHVHVAIKMREPGLRALNPGRRDLQRFRETIAVKARAHGLCMVATRRRDVMGGRPYTAAQAAVVDKKIAQAKTYGRVIQKRVGAPEVTDHPKVLAQAEEASRGWKETANFFAKRKAGAPDKAQSEKGQGKMSSPHMAGDAARVNDIADKEPTSEPSEDGNRTASVADERMALLPADVRREAQACAAHQADMIDEAIAYWRPRAATLEAEDLAAGGLDAADLDSADLGSRLITKS